MIYHQNSSLRTMASPGSASGFRHQCSIAGLMPPQSGSENRIHFPLRNFLQRVKIPNILSSVVMVLAIIALFPSMGRAEDLYIAQSAAGSGNGSSCANALAYTFFNTSGNWGAGAGKITAGDTVHVCGTITGSSNATVLTFQGSGSAGSPITLFFEAGAIVQAPYCKPAAGGSPGGCISAMGRNYITIDGNSGVGKIQNSLNGASGAACPGGACTQQATSTLLDLQSCNNCTVQGVNFANSYLEVQNAASENSTNEVSIMLYGSNQTLANNIFTNCGWCVNFFYSNGNANYEAYGNTFTNFGHAFALAAGAAGAACGVAGSTTNWCSSIHDNIIGPAGTAWDASGCPNHKDGIHYFGNGNSPQNGTYIYNNWIGGNWGTCSTGFIYTDNVDPYIRDLNMWNNIFKVGSTSENPNGWVLVSNDGGGVLRSVNNTLIGSGIGDNSIGFVYFSNGNLTIEGNIITGIGDPIRIEGAVTAVDYNLYGATQCANGNNCYIWSGAFKSSFAGWKTACACDAHSVSNTSPGVNADGTLASTSAARGVETNLSSLATGNLATLASDTTNGGQRSAVARPSSPTAWDIGAYQYGAAPASYSLTVSSAGTGTGTISGSNCATGSLTSGTSVTCHGAVAAGNTFVGWAGTGSASSCTGTSDCIFTITGTTTATATFNTAGVTTYTLSTATAGTGTGTITGCAGTGIAAGTAYSCTVTAGGGSTLASVSGCGGSGTTTYTGSMPGADCTVTATFNLAAGPGGAVLVGVGAGVIR